MTQTIPPSDFVDALFAVWEEILGQPATSGGATLVLDDDAGWAHSLAKLSAEAASRPIAPGGTTIAAQTAHAAYYLERFEAIIANRHECADWPGSLRPDADAAGGAGLSEGGAGLRYRRPRDDRFGVPTPT